MLTDKQQAAAAKKFAKDWEGEHSEDQEAQSFWGNLLEKVFGIEDASQGKNKHINFEKRVKLQGTTKKIDGYIPSTRVLIENKSSHISLDQAEPFPGKPIPINAYGQAKEYDNHLPYLEKAEWIITCNFKEFWIYDMKEAENIRKPIKLALSDLGRDYKQLRMLVDNRSFRLIQEEEVSVKAGELVKKMYNLLEKQYPELDENTRRNLNILCVRIVFCLYAEDAGVFERNQFHDYLERYDAADFGERLEKLFEVLNMPEEERSLSLSEQLKAFPYTNGGLFAEKIEVPPFTDELRALILDKASLGFNWCNISPTIFGALFESTINPETRSEGGMHYTSIENIHKVIDPLFLDDLKQELDGCLRKKQHETDASQRQRLVDFQNKLASLRFLDPACGSGNFLTETYLSLREMENIVIRNIYKGQEGAHNIRLSLSNPIKVSINQFYGIEINDFAVSVAQVALWISEAKMLAKTEEIVGHTIDFLPLRSYTNIHEGNALRMEWNDIVPSSEVNYIMGNPPFVGAMWMKGKKREDVELVFPECPKVGEIDYVAGWYAKAAKYISGTDIRCAFVSTNSICQGQQVALIWKPMMEEFGVHIDFAHRTFIWDNESTEMAHVHCVIVGFSTTDNPNERTIYCEDGSIIKTSNINGYLSDADNIFILARREQVSNMPLMHMGVMARDGGNLIMSQEERDEYVASEPQGAKWIHRYMMGREFINNTPRYCFWLLGANPAEINRCPLLLKRIEKVREARLESTAAETRELASTPFLFAQLAQPTADFIAFPKVSSEQRQYIPIGFLTPDIIIGDQVYVVENVGIYHFGVLTSSIHNVWMRAVAGRMKSDYRYSNTIVYNNFPWPTPTETQKEKIEKTAQVILDARAKYPDASLSVLYNKLTMPPELLQAHKANDLAVMKAYGFSTKMTEEDIVKALFKMYQQLTGNE